MTWVAISDREPPKYGTVIYGWWCYWPDFISWEYSDDWACPATHWCLLPKEPAPDPARVPSRCKATGAS